MIWIIVPTFARIEETKIFIKSINNVVEKEYLIILIDDHPKKITEKQFKDTKNIKVLAPLNELWWVGSINLGIKTLFDKYDLKDEDIVIFANNDMQIDKNSFDILMNELNKNKNQIVHPRTFDQDNREVSSGTKILSYFPYITVHPKNFKENKVQIDMGTARFLCMKIDILKKVGFINKNLVQYLGDNDFTLKAKKIHDINTYILKESKCLLDDTQTGSKNTNIKSLEELWSSFFSIKSPNNIKYRYVFFANYFNPIFSFFITSSMTINSIIKFFIGKMK